MAIEHKAKGDRDGKGRFRKGWKGGPGRPPRLAEQAVLDAVHSSVTPEEIAAAVRSLASEAGRGDVRACVALLKVAFGDLSLIQLLEREAARGTGAMAQQSDERIAQVLALDPHWSALLRAEFAKNEQFEQKESQDEKEVEQPAEQPDSQN